MNYKLHLNLATIQLKNASKKHINYFKSQFFQIKNKKSILTITVEFKKINIPDQVKILEEDFKFDNDANSYIFDTQKKALKINFKKLKLASLVCEVDPDFDLYYLYSFILEPLLIIFGVQRNILFIHSSAIEKDGKSILYPAWRHTGKTHLLLNKTINEKYNYMGDDFTLIYKKNLYLYPKKINLFSYNLKGFPKLYSLIPPQLRFRLQIMTLLKDSLERFSYTFSGSMGKIFFRISQLAEVATNFKTNPKNIHISVTEKSKLDTIIILQRASYFNQKIVKKEIAFKLTQTILFELQDFFAIYNKSCYVFGDTLSSKIDSFEDEYKNLVEKNIKNSQLQTVQPE